MSSSNISLNERRHLEKFIKFLCIKSTQIVVQGRIGKPIATASLPSSSGSEWVMFNLAIKDYPDIDREAKAALSDGNPNANRSYVIEISLRTSDADALTLEVWSIGFINKSEELHVRQKVYNRITLLLKSLLCLSRITPAYKLSRRQGADFVMCYRVYMGQISLSGLGEGFKTLRVGTVATPIGTYSMSAAYRTTENLHLSTQQISPEAIMPFELHDDHFALSKSPSSSSAKPCCSLQSRMRTLSESSDGAPAHPVESNRNSPSYNIFSTSFSKSPMKKGGGREDALAAFTVGTPPGGNASSPRSPSSPIFGKGGYRSSNPTSPREEYASSSRSGVHSLSGDRRHSTSYKSNSRRDSFPTTSGKSVPLRHYVTGTSPTVCDGDRLTSADYVKSRNSVKTAPNLTTYCHWNNSNVTKVTAGHGNSTKVDTEQSNVTKVTAGHKIITAGSRPRDKSDWTLNAKMAGLNLLANSPPPVCETGAFVKCDPETDKGESSPFTGLANFPFLDLMSPTEDEDTPDEDGSHRSSSSSSADEPGERCKKRSSLTSQGSSSGLSSKPSSESLEQAQHSDEFVMVDLNPAFARSDSIEDLGTFYQECKNAPELVLFEEGRDMETEETLLELSKQLDDYENEIEDFDAFIQSLTAE